MEPGFGALHFCLPGLGSVAVVPGLTESGSTEPAPMELSRGSTGFGLKNWRDFELDRALLYRPELLL